MCVCVIECVWGGGARGKVCVCVCVCVSACVHACVCARDKCNQCLCFKSHYFELMEQNEDTLYLERSSDFEPNYQQKGLEEKTKVVFTKDR